MNVFFTDLVYGEKKVKGEFQCDDQCNCARRSDLIWLVIAFASSRLCPCVDSGEVALPLSPPCVQLRAVLGAFLREPGGTPSNQLRWILLPLRLVCEGEGFDDVAVVYVTLWKELQLLWLL